MLEKFYLSNPYDWEQKEKDYVLTEELLQLTRYHQGKCKEYADLLRALEVDLKQVNHYSQLPFFPVRLFKERELMSVEQEQIFKVMTSSGTTGQRVSKIFVDKDTAMLQQKTMIKILSDYWGKKRLPMLIVDSPKVVKDRTLFSARGAAVIGLTMMASEMVYVLNEDMSLNEDVLDEFMLKYGERPFVVFGFTFMIWEHFYGFLKKCNKTYHMSKAYLFTGGGWKKLEHSAVSREQFKEEIRNICGIEHFIDHYGMVEQTGCIYAECEYGHLHASIFSDVITRRASDFSICEIGEPGIVQVVSVLPHSYPGHSLLTEDEGVVLGVDDCPCGRKGKYIKITGRIKNAEIRGCSDTYAADYR